ncbi:MAG: NIPSNAP family protein [Opitutae bacterium]|nr:NIPSNAP family protein [Opitutae bacterium]
MKRRTFLSTAAGASALLAIKPTAVAAEAGANSSSQQYFELIKYRLLVGPKKKLFTDYVKNALIPALNRAGIATVGAFTVKYGPNDPTLYLLLPHASLESVVSTPARLLADTEYLKAAAGVVDAPLSDPAYAGIETIVLRAFTGMPRIEPPTALLKHNARIYELRIYESSSQKVGKKKVEMFNEGGEIEIFRRTGLLPVMFGETVIGGPQPSLQYLLAFENMDARDKCWAVFGKDPAWVKLRADPQYADTVSNITDLILSPLPCSQI